MRCIPMMLFCSMHTLSLPRMMLICLSCLLYAIRLAFFVALHLFTFRRLASIGAETEKPSPLSRALIRPPAMATAPACMGPRWRAALGVIVLFTWSFGCSLSRWRKVGLPLVLGQESGPNFKGLPKVSGFATNHWFFLWCDWSPISSWFYHRS